MRTNIYIDGFNLYYGCLKGTSLRWLDVRKFCEQIVGAKHTLNRIRYFTARVKAHPLLGAATQQRQQIYLRAVATLGIHVHYGHYQQKNTKAIEFPVTNPPKWVQILKNEEKGSDVNIGAHLLMDGFRKDYERAIVVSNDSDLATPIRMVRDELKLPIGVVFPCTNPNRSKSGHLLKVATFYHDVWVSTLK